MSPNAVRAAAPCLPVQRGTEPTLSSPPPTPPTHRSAPARRRARRRPGGGVWTPRRQVRARVCGGRAFCVRLPACECNHGLYLQAGRMHACRAQSAPAAHVHWTLCAHARSALHLLCHVLPTQGAQHTRLRRRHSMDGTLESNGGGGGGGGGGQGLLACIVVGQGLLACIVVVVAPLAPSPADGLLPCWPLPPCTSFQGRGARPRPRGAGSRALRDIASLKRFSSPSHLGLALRPPGVGEAKSRGLPARPLLRPAVHLRPFAGGSSARTGQVALE